MVLVRNRSLLSDKVVQNRKVIKMNKNVETRNSLIEFTKTDDIVSDMKHIIETSQKNVYQAINTALVYRNWLMGYRISEEILKVDNRAEYGGQVIKKLSKELTRIYGKGFDRANLYRCYKFYKCFPEIVDSVRRQSSGLLSWTHYRVLIQVESCFSLV